MRSGGQETRDEIGFLAHPPTLRRPLLPRRLGLHTRVRYGLLIPWLFEYAAENPMRGSNVPRSIERLLIQLAKRLKPREPYHVISGDKLGQPHQQDSIETVMRMPEDDRHKYLLSLSPWPHGAAAMGSD